MENSKKGLLVVLLCVGITSTLYVIQEASGCFMPLPVSIAVAAIVGVSVGNYVSKL